MAGLRTCVAFVLISLASATPAQENAAGVPSDVQQAFAAIERAPDYAALVTVLRTYQATLGSPRVLALIDQLLAVPDLPDAQRALVQLERALAQDVATLGPDEAARASAARLIALAALRADTPEELAGVMTRFAPLADRLDAHTLRNALAAPAGWWPPALFPLLEQLGQDWRAYGALNAAERMAEAAAASAPGGYVEDRIGDTLIDLGQPIPDGLIHMPQY